jgi:hypothetical protein
VPDPNDLPLALFAAWLYFVVSLVAAWYAWIAYLRAYQKGGNVLPPLPARSGADRLVRALFPDPLLADYIRDRPAARARARANREALRTKQADPRLESLRRRVNRLRWVWIGTPVVYIVAAAAELSLSPR